MYKLIVDCSTSLMYLGLVKENKIIFEIKKLAIKDHASFLTFLIDKLLKKKKIKIELIDEIIVGKGPGSYTGIRVAGSFCKTFSYARKINLKSISSLFLLTSGYQKKDHIFPLYSFKNKRSFIIEKIENNTIFEKAISLDDLNLYLNNRNKLELNLLENKKILPKIIKVNYDNIFPYLTLEDEMEYLPNYLND